MAKEFMTKAEFVNLIMTVADEFGVAKTVETKRVDTTYTGVTLDVTGIPVPVVNTDKLYAEYCNGKSVESISRIVRDIFNTDPEIPLTMDELTDWNIVKDRIFLRLVREVDDGMYRKVADMCLVPYVSVAENKGLMARITPEWMNSWGVTEDMVFEQAKNNQETLRPAKIESLADRVGQPEEEPSSLYIVSVKSGCCGASAITYDSVPTRIRNLIGEFYIIPASIHETIVIPKEGKDPEDLKMMVEFVNKTQVADEDILSYSVYTYDFDKKEIVKVA